MAVLDIEHRNNAVKTLSEAYPKQNIVFIQTDVTDKQNVRKSFQEVVDQFKSIDIVISNAGMINEAEYEQTISVNLVRMMFSKFMR